DSDGGIAAVRAGLTALQTVDLAALPDDEFEGLLAAFETCRRIAESVSHRLLIETSDRRLPRMLGRRGLHRYLVETLRLSRFEAASRIDAAHALGVFREPSGAIREPALPATATAQAEGAISPTHARAVMRVMHRLPDAIDTATRALAEEHLADAARTLAPEQLTHVGDRLLGFLDPDGTLTTDHDRARQRGLTLSPQRLDGMSDLTGCIDPELRALLDTVLAKWARPGMCMPDDPDSPHPGTHDPDTIDADGVHGMDVDTVRGDGTTAGSVTAAGRVDAGVVSADSAGAGAGGPGGVTVAGVGAAGFDPARLHAAITRDTRTTTQRNHDALKAFLSSGGGPGRTDLGTHRGLPVAVTLTMDVTDLLRGTGHAVTATGTTIPIRDAWRMAEDAIPLLMIFDRHHGKPLYLGEGPRLASSWQRRAKTAIERGCTRPGCTAPATMCAMHHIIPWAKGGPTDIDNLTLVCDSCHAHITADPDNPHGWATETVPPGSALAGRTQWRPPVEIDPHRTPQVNHLHHPEHILAESLKRYRAK
ncbi:HNH endonuclease signature motif containing protein, partial [Nocardia otitidiscaviarum]|uniref:HNH endonuclease signature motif containing protein n=1 Tax=Nocardia otitidiscaviarum TaxID=1823 RepID=UPI002456D387